MTLWGVGDVDVDDLFWGTKGSNIVGGLNVGSDVHVCGCLSESFCLTIGMVGSGVVLFFGANVSGNVWCLTVGSVVYVGACLREGLVRNLKSLVVFWVCLSVCAVFWICFSDCSVLGVGLRGLVIVSGGVFEWLGSFLGLFQ